MEACLLKALVIVLEGRSNHPDTTACEENVCTLLSPLGNVWRKGKWNENNKLTRCHELFPDYCLIHAFTVSGNYATGLTALALGRENSQRRRAFLTFIKRTWSPSATRSAHTPVMCALEWCQQVKAAQRQTLHHVLSRSCRLPCQVIIIPLCLFMTRPLPRVIGFPLRRTTAQWNCLCCFRWNQKLIIMGVQ